MEEYARHWIWTNVSTTWVANHIFVLMMRFMFEIICSKNEIIKCQCLFCEPGFYECIWSQRIWLHDQRAASRQLHQELAQQKNRQLMDSYQATHKLQHQKYARGKSICLPYVNLAPFPKQFSKKTLLKRGSGRTIFLGGKWRWGTAGPILVSFQRILAHGSYLFGTGTRVRTKKRKAVAVKPLRCMAALRLNKSVLVHPQRVDWTWPAELETLLSAVTACVWKMSRGSNMFKPKNVLIMKEEVSWLVWQQKGGNFSRPEKKWKMQQLLDVHAILW